MVLHLHSRMNLNPAVEVEPIKERGPNVDASFLVTKIIGLQEVKFAVRVEVHEELTIRYFHTIYDRCHNSGMVAAC